VRTLFADAGYWVALFLPEDDWHVAAVEAATSVADARILTTDEVLTEFLTFFAAFSPNTRKAAALMVRELLARPEVEVLPASRDSFLSGLALYAQRLDKQYSLQDCISFAAMRARGITDALTPDHHYEQEGFVILLRR